MGSKKLLKKLSAFFDMDARALSQQKDELNELLGRLKKKEVQLIELQEATTDTEELKRLSKKIDVVHSQRKKGIKMLKELKEEISASNS